jgi:predicted PurR-regulated permease PerM
MNSDLPAKNQSRILWFALTGLAIAAVVALIVAGVWGLAQLLDVLSPVLWPLAIAGVVACLLSPVVDFLERRKISRGSAIIIVFVIAFAVFASVLVSVIPQVVNETQQLAKKVPEYSQRLQTRVEKFVAQPPEFLRHFLPPQIADTTATSTNSPANSNPPTPSNANNANANATAGATSWLTASLPKWGAWLFGQIGKVASGFGMLAGLALVPVYAFYFLLEKRGIEKHWQEYLPVRDSKAKNEIVFVLDSISQYLVAFFRGQVLVAITDAILFTIGFLCVGLNYAFLLGFLAVFLMIIPFLGAIIICLSASILAFVQFGDWLHPLLVVGVFALVQTLEGLFISPKIMGDRVGLHPLVIIIAVMTGTTLLGGIIGGVLAIPLAAALRVIMFRYIWVKAVDA